MSVANKIAVHFSPEIIKRINQAETKAWASAVRDWHHDKDTVRNFGRNASNSPYVGNTWAWHVHMAPDEDVATSTELRKWKSPDPYHRTSDRLLVYSRSQDDPMSYGILLLAFLAPKGHEGLKRGVMLSDWEDIAYTHQTNGSMPPGTITGP